MRWRWAILKKVLVFLLLVLFLPLWLSAGTTGKIAGIVRDAETKTVLTGVNVLLPGTSLVATTTADGTFFLLNVPPGSHSLQLSMIGYARVTVTLVQVSPDATTHVELSLHPQVIAGESMTITADRSMLQKERTCSATTLSGEEIRSMPVHSFSEAILLTNGFIVNNKGAANRSQQIYIRGSRSNEFACLIDGVYVKDELFGGAVADIPLESIQELSVISGAFNAEYGEAMSAVVNIVTKEGSPEYHGQLHCSGDQFGSKRYDNNTSRLEASLSGPLAVMNGTFSLSGDNFSTDTWLHEFASHVHDRSGNPLTRVHHPLTFTNKERYNGSLVLHPAKNFKLAARYNRYFEKMRLYGEKYKEIPDRLGLEFSSSHLANITMTHTLNPKTFYTTRLSWYNHAIKHEHTSDLASIHPPRFNPAAFGGTSKNEYYGPYLHHVELDTLFIPRDGLPDSMAVISDSVYVQSDDNFWMLYKVDEYAVAGDVTSQVHANHMIKAGVEYKYNRVYDDRLMGINAKGPGRHDQETHYSYQPVRAAAFLQDKMEFNRLVINAGLRLDYLDPRASYAPDLSRPLERKPTSPKMQISPRLGAGLHVTNRLQLHFGWGYFCQFPDFHMLYRRIDLSDPAGPVNLSRGGVAVIGNANMKAQRTSAWEFGAATALSTNLSSRIVFFYKDIKDYIATRFFDIKPRPYFSIVNLDYARTGGVEISLDKRFSSHWAAGINYTWTRSEGNADDWQTHYLEYMLRTTTGPVPTQKTIAPGWAKPHTLTTQLDLREPENWGLHLIASLSSGEPYTRTDAKGKYISGINAGRMPWYGSIDLRLNKEFHIFNLKQELFINVWNLLDRKNVYTVFGDTGRPDYTTNPNVSEEYMQEPNRYGPPRTIEIGIQVKY